MPTFYADDIDIDVDEFLNRCSGREVEELVDALVEDGYVKRIDSSSDHLMSVPEKEFEEALNKLHGKYQSLTKEEEDLIKSISKRF